MARKGSGHAEPVVLSSTVQVRILDEIIGLLHVYGVQVQLPAEVISLSDDEDARPPIESSPDREPGIIGSEPGVMPAPAAELIGCLPAFPSPGQLHTDHKSADDSCPAPAKRR